jgi:hypothetical protein
MKYRTAEPRRVDDGSEDWEHNWHAGFQFEGSDGDSQCLPGEWEDDSEEVVSNGAIDSDDSFDSGFGIDNEDGY